MTHVTAAFDFASWRWRHDNGDETSTGASWAQAAETNILWNASIDPFLRLRTLVEETAGGSGNANLALEWRVNSGSWTALGSTGAVKFFDSADLTNGNNCTDHGISPTGGGSFITANAGQCEDGDAGTLSYAANEYAIQEYTLEFDDALITNNDIFDFRIAGLDTYTSVDASIQVQVNATRRVFVV